MFMIDSPVLLGQKVYTKYGQKYREWTVVGFWISMEEEYNSFHAARYDKQGKLACTMSYRFSDVGKIIFTSLEEMHKNS